MHLLEATAGIPKQYCNLHVFFFLIFLNKYMSAGLVRFLSFDQTNRPIFNFVVGKTNPDWTKSAGFGQFDQKF